jgi:aminopeptidase N
VILPSAIEAGKQYALTMEYAGDKVIRKAGGGNFSVGARTSWYPSVNSFQDRARYDLTFKFPKRFTLVSVGKLVKEWKEKDSVCSQWVSDVPLAVAGFNYGDFLKKTTTDPKSGFVVEGYATSTLPDWLKAAEDSIGGMTPTRLNERVMSEAQAATTIFELFFGKSGFGRVAVTQQPAFNYGQSWPTLIYLPLSAYFDSTQRYLLMGGVSSSLTAFVNEVTAHEVAHQWWGHMVGWKTHHDQWLSEGFAVFSASLFLQYTEKTLDKYLKYWKDSRERILAKNEWGRQPGDAGPIWLGERLDTFKNDSAYRALVYEKGGYVLHMLRQLMYDPKEGDKYFADMMRDFVKQHLNQNATTEAFQRVVEQHMRPSMDLAGNGKMDWFFNQWVYGTAIPRYKLDYTLEQQADGKCLFKGTISQNDAPAGFMMAMPLYADFDGQVTRLGVVRLTGSTTIPVSVMLPKKPKKVMLNARYDVLEQ